MRYGRSTVLAFTVCMMLVARPLPALAHTAREDSCGGHKDQSRAYHVHDWIKYCACHPCSGTCNDPSAPRPMPPGTDGVFREILPALPDPELGSIGVTVRTPKGRAAGRIYFVRLEDDEDALIAEYVIRSNYYFTFTTLQAIQSHVRVVEEQQVYLLNTKPGRYVAVAARLPSKGNYSFSQAFFSMEMIPLTEVTVGPGQMVFMGDFLVDLDKSRISNADEAQAHYHHVMSPDAISPDDAEQYRLTEAVAESLVTPGLIDMHGIHVDRLVDRLRPEVEQVFEEFFLALIIPKGLLVDRIYKAKLNSVAKDAESESAFWVRARDAVFMKSPAWQRQVQLRLDALREGGQ